jgi:hypothetical protein
MEEMLSAYFTLMKRITMQFLRLLSFAVYSYHDDNFDYVDAFY